MVFFFSFTVSAFFQTFLLLFYLKKNLVAKVCMQGSLDLYSLEIWCFDDNFFKTHIFEDCLKKNGKQTLRAYLIIIYGLRKKNQI